MTIALTVPADMLLFDEEERCMKIFVDENIPLMTVKELPPPSALQAPHEPPQLLCLLSKSDTKSRKAGLAFDRLRAGPFDLLDKLGTGRLRTGKKKSP